MLYHLGIDLGGTNIAVGIVDENYKIIGRGNRKTALPRAAELIVEDMVEACKEACENAGITLDDVSSFGVGSPGAIDSKNGIVAAAYNLDFFNLPLSDMLYERTGKRFYIENDANAAAYGEFSAGAGKGTKDFVAITLGTGVGGGMIVDGKIFTGGNFTGGEFGHHVICVGGEQCTCGRKGCFEAYASATALIRQTKQKMLENKDSLMWKLTDGNIENVNGKVPFDAAEQGDKAGKEVVETYASYVAAGITNIVNILQPECVGIGGGVSAQKENLVAPIREQFEKEVFSKGVLPPAKIVAAELGNDAGIIGAAMLYKMYE